VGMSGGTARRLLVASVGGFVLISVAAWLATLLVVLPAYRRSPDRSWPEGVPSGWPPVDDATVHEAALLTATRRYTIGPGGSFVADTFRAGWPCRALEATRFDCDSMPGATAPESASTLWHRGLFELPVLRKGTPLAERRLPIKPLLPGFAVDWLFFGAIVWTLTWATAFVRRRRRLRKGLCRQCGYPLEGAACPECGTVAAK
jgi:hypothetical protein